MSILGITIGTAALLLILSVFNGFGDLIGSLFNSFNPDLKLTPSKGIYLELNEEQISKLKRIKGLDKFSFILEEVVLFDYDGIQEAGYLKGVDNEYSKVTNIDSTIINGKFTISDADINFAVLGSGIFNKLSVNPSDPLTPIRVFAPVKNNAALGKDYNSGILYPAGVFSISSEEDAQYVITNIELVRFIIEKPLAYNALEMDIKNTGDEKEVENQLRIIFGNEVNIKNRYQQNESFLKIMNIEKWIAYLIACLTLALITFNLIGALYMIVLDKKKDIGILKSMGFDEDGIKKIFLNLGLFIGAIGMILGFVIAIVLYFMQKKYGLLSVPPGFLIDAYPVKMKASDVFIVIFTVFILAYLAALLPAKKAAKFSTQVR